MPGGVGVVDGWIVAAGVERLPVAGGGTGRDRAGGRVMPVDELAIPGRHNLEMPSPRSRPGCCSASRPTRSDGGRGLPGRGAPARDGRRGRWRPLRQRSQGTQPDAVIAALRVVRAAADPHRRGPRQGRRSRAARGRGRPARDLRDPDRRELPRRSSALFAAAGLGSIERAASLEDAVRRASELAAAAREGRSEWGTGTRRPAGHRAPLAGGVELRHVRRLRGSGSGVQGRGPAAPGYGPRSRRTDDPSG